MRNAYTRASHRLAEVPLYDPVMSKTGYRESLIPIIGIKNSRGIARDDDTFRSKAISPRRDHFI